MLIRNFTGLALENTRTMNLDYNYYILQELDLKMFGLQILILIIYLTGFGLENNCTTNLD